jgi:ABC-type xylose transport system permease subunit
MKTQTQTKNLSISERISSPTPAFFKKIRAIGLTLGAIGGAILAAPVALPAAITTLAGYLLTAGIVTSAISTTAVETGSGKQR